MEDTVSKAAAKVELSKKKKAPKKKRAYKKRDANSQAGLEILETNITNTKARIKADKAKLKKMLKLKRQWDKFSKSIAVFQ